MAVAEEDVLRGIRDSTRRAMLVTVTVPCQPPRLPLRRAHLNGGGGTLVHLEEGNVEMRRTLSGRQPFRPLGGRLFFGSWIHPPHDDRVSPDLLELSHAEQRRRHQQHAEQRPDKPRPLAHGMPHTDQLHEDAQPCLAAPFV